MRPIIELNSPAVAAMALTTTSSEITGLSGARQSLRLYFKADAATVARFSGGTTAQTANNTTSNWISGGATEVFGTPGGITRFAAKTESGTGTLYICECDGE